MTWVPLAAPLQPRAARAGLRWAVLLRGWMPTLLVGVVLFRSYPPAAATILFAGYIGTCMLLVSGILLRKPRLPLSTDQTTWPGITAFVGLNLLGIFGGVVYTVLMEATTSFGWIGLALGGFGLLALSLLVVLSHWAADRQAPTWEHTD